MLKSFKIALFAIVSIPILDTVAVTAQPIGPSTSRAIADSDAVCYMITSDGRTLNLTTLCGTLNQSQRTQVSSAPASYTQSRPNLGGLDIYGRGPGAPPCYGLDNNGRPCPTSRS